MRYGLQETILYKEFKISFDCQLRRKCQL